jgi:hypothetical protein
VSLLAWHLIEAGPLKPIQSERVRFFTVGKGARNDIHAIMEKVVTSLRAYEQAWCPKVKETSQSETGLELAQQ